jgi:hypothetical protein
VTIILGGDSLLHKKKQKTPKSTNGRRDATLRREGATVVVQTFSNKSDIVNAVKSWHITHSLEYRVQRLMCKHLAMNLFNFNV